MINAGVTSKNQEIMHLNIQNLLKTYALIFLEPKELPPERPCDHVINLIPGAQPLNLRPYRYSYDYKNAIESIINDMLKAFTIIPSQFPFASPSLLVKKKDSTWRLYVDYRRLNNLTVKNKYLIPMIDDLLDELFRVVVFSKVEYLGYIINGAGVSTYQSKVIAMVDWPQLKIVKELRGFLGLTGYYRKFMKGYAYWSKTLTNLLKKGEFQWTEEATKAFKELKRAMTSTPVVALPDFTKVFILEVDACNTGIRAVLKQDKRAIDFMSQALIKKHLGMSTYDKELVALL
ncbi:hypothetical protein FXO37_08572 [Capsicum annuum]|nr:hypothetical protein FXO37_08572 [Capsicum annuum]